VHHPCSIDLVHYEVVVEEAIDGESPAVGIATCSPLWPTPTCILLRDFFRWKAEGKGRFSYMYKYLVTSYQFLCWLSGYIQFYIFTLFLLYN